MQTIKVEIQSEAVLVLLRQLEKLGLLNISSMDDEPVTEKKTSRKWAGTLSKETGAKMLEHVNQSRNEWERDI